MKATKTKLSASSDRKKSSRPKNFSSLENACVRTSYNALMRSLEVAKSESPEAAKAWVKRIAAISM